MQSSGKRGQAIDFEPVICYDNPIRSLPLRGSFGKSLERPRERSLKVGGLYEYDTKTQPSVRFAVRHVHTWWRMGSALYGESVLSGWTGNFDAEDPEGWPTVLVCSTMETSAPG